MQKSRAIKKRQGTEKRGKKNEAHELAEVTHAAIHYISTAVGLQSNPVLNKATLNVNTWAEHPKLMLTNTNDKSGKELKTKQRKTINR